MEDEITLHPSPQSVSAEAGSSYDSESSLSAPSTPAMSLHEDNEAPIPRESLSIKRPGCTEQKKRCRSAHGGKRVYYLCGKCQHLALTRLAYNQHVSNCYGRKAAPRSGDLANVRALYFNTTPRIRECSFCETYTQQIGPLMACHEFICGERRWRGETGDPPYIPPAEEWVITSECSRAPADFEKTMREFSRGGLWEVEEYNYLKNKQLWYLLPKITEVNETEKLSISPRNVDAAALKRAEDKLSDVVQLNDKVAVCKPMQIKGRRRQRQVARADPDPNRTMLFGSVYDVNKQCIVGHMVSMGEPRFGTIYFRSPRSSNDSFYVMHSVTGQGNRGFYVDGELQKVAATVALHNTKTGRIVGVFETAKNPRTWEDEYYIDDDKATGNPVRMPTIAVTYTEIPTELLNYFSVKQLSPIGSPASG